MNRVFHIADSDYRVCFVYDLARVPTSGMAAVCREAPSYWATFTEGSLRFHLRKQPDRFVACLMQQKSLVGFSLLRRAVVATGPTKAQPIAVVEGNCFHRGYELGGAALSLGLYQWLADQHLHPWPATDRQPPLNRAVQWVRDRDLHVQGSLESLGWRQCGERRHKDHGILLGYYLCTAYNLNLHEIFQNVRRNTLSRS